MNKCFITKLPSSVDNDSLPVLGQLRIDWLKQNDLTDNDARAIGLSTNDSITVKVSGAHFTDDTLLSNLGNSKTITKADGLIWLYVSNGADAILTIDNKYSLKELNFIKSRKVNLERSVKFDINDIRYCTALTNLGLGNTQVSGDISAVSLLTALTILALNNTQVSGDISALSQLTALTYFNLSNTQVSGDISALSNLTNIGSLALSDTLVSGSVNSLANLTKLTDIGGLRGISLTGDMSRIPANVGYIGLSGIKLGTNFTWTANGRQNVTFLGMDYSIPFDTTSMDNMLIDQATCTVASDASSSRKVISVSGTRTSASDAAVAALQNKGITITGVTKQA